MPRIRPGVLLWLVMMIAACNLTTEAPITPEPFATAVVSPSADVTPTSAVPVLTAIGPTALPGLPPPPLFNLTPGSSGAGCAVYLTYSGSDPANLLSLRDQPSVSARQVLRVPNHTQVLLLPNSQEVEADGYHWLNVIYVDASQNRHEGWMARDSYSAGGVRNPSISTLRPTGQQSPC